VTTEEKLIRLADAVREADEILKREPEARAVWKVQIEAAPILAKALKLVLEQRDSLYHINGTHITWIVDGIDLTLFNKRQAELDALVKDQQ
jgi:hypothetical protein